MTAPFVTKTYDTVSAVVRATSFRYVPLETNTIVNILAASVPVASVPVVPKPVPNVSVLLEDVAWIVSVTNCPGA